MNQRSLFDLLILDYGGVYSFEYNLNSFDIIMNNTFGRKPTTEERKQISVYSHELTAGTITSEQYVAEVAKLLRAEKPDVKTFEDNTFAVTFEPSRRMRELIYVAKKAGVKVALLSNMYLFEVLRTKSSERYKGFDYVAFSAESKLTKNDSLFFSNVLKHFDIDASKTLFVDDVKEYVKTAQMLGMHTIHANKKQFSSAQELASAIQIKLNI